MSGYSKKASDIWESLFEYEKYFSNFVVNRKLNLDYLVFYKENRPSEDSKEIKEKWDLKMAIVEEG